MPTISYCRSNVASRHAEEIAAAASSGEPTLTVDLIAREIRRAGGATWPFAIDDEGHPFNRFRREDMDIGRKGNLRLPRFQRVVIAQDGKDLYIILCQFMQEAHVIELCRQVVIGTGVDIAGDEDSVDPIINGHLDDFLETALLQQESGRQCEVLGIREEGRVLGVVVVRPLLMFSLNRNEVSIERSTRMVSGSSGVRSTML